MTFWESIGLMCCATACFCVIVIFLMALGGRY